MTIERCDWCKNDPMYMAYHDEEWGKPIYDDRLLFEFLILEGMQAGLSWLTILKKREHMRTVFDNFLAEKIVSYDKAKINQLMGDPGIIRNERKILALIQNAKAYLTLQKNPGDFSNYLWQFVDGIPVQNAWREFKEIPAHTPISDHMAKELKKKNFNFVGSTICYALMQAVGMVNDHLTNCFRYKQLNLPKSKLKQFRPGKITGNLP